MFGWCCEGPGGHVGRRRSVNDVGGPLRDEPGGRGGRSRGRGRRRYRRRPRRLNRERRRCVRRRRCLSPRSCRRWRLSTPAPALLSSVVVGSLAWARPDPVPCVATRSVIPVRAIGPVMPWRCCITAGKNDVVYAQILRKRYAGCSVIRLSRAGPPVFMIGK